VGLSKQVSANAAANGSGYNKEQKRPVQFPVATGLRPVGRTRQDSQRQRTAPWLQRAHKQKRPVRFFQTGRL